MNTIFLLSSAYLLGSIPFGKIISFLYGVDIQKRGSGNIGFANVLRILGWPAALLTLAGDIAKGAVPVYIALQLADAKLAVWVGLAAMVGHVFPVWLGFRGGKGVATGFGVMVVLQPAAALAGGAIYIIGGLAGKKSSVSSFFGTVAVLVLAMISAPSLWWQFLILAGLIAWKLRHNMRGSVPNYG